MVSSAVIERGKALVQTLGVTLEEHLGTGNFGIVYRGVDSEGRLVAVKFVEKREYVNYLEREISIQCSLNHENLVRLYQFIVCFILNSLHSCFFLFLVINVFCCFAFFFWIG